MAASDGDRGSRPERLALGLAVAAGLLLCGDILHYAWSRAHIEIAMGRLDCGLVLGYILFLILALCRRRMAVRVSLALLAALAALLLCEAVLGLAHSRRPYLWPPYTARAIRLQADLPGVSPEGLFSVNSLGLRGPELSADDTYRILVVGGSAVECLYLDNEKAWPRLLGKQLAEHGREPIWVGNAGRSGLNAVDHGTALRLLPEAGEADCWLVMCGVNDLGPMLQGDYAERKRQTLERTFLGSVGPVRRPYYRNLLLYRRFMARSADRSGRAVLQDMDGKFYETLRRKRQAAPKTDALPALEPLLAEYAGSLREIARLARERGKRLVFATQPVLWQKDMPGRLEALIYGGQLPDGTFLSAGALAEAMQAFNERMRTVAASAAAECFDLAAALPRTDAVFYDDCHLNEEGARQAARQLADYFLLQAPDKRNGPRR